MATGVRGIGLADRVLWFDEAVSLLVARAPAGDGIAAAIDDTHPPLYHVLLHGWGRLLPGELGARWFSVVAGVVTVGVVFLLGRQLGGPTAGIVAGLTLAVSPLHVWYSQEIRMYAAHTLLVTVSWWLLTRAIAMGGWAAWGRYAVVTVLALYTQYTTVFAILAQAAYVGWRARPVGRAWLVAMGVTGLLFVPWLPVLWHHLTAATFGFWMREFQWADPVRFFALFSGAIQRNPTPYWPWVGVTVFVLAAAVWAIGRRDSENSVSFLTLLLLWLLVPVAGLALLSLRENVFLPRSILYVTPAFALLVGLASAAARPFRFVVAGLLAANGLALGAYFLLPNPWLRSQLRDAAALVAREHRPGDLVVHTSRFSYRPFQCYLGSAVAQGLERETVAMPRLFAVIGDSRLPGDRRAFQRVWFVEYVDFQQQEPGKETRQWLQEEFDAGREVFVGQQFVVTLHERRAATESATPSSTPATAPR